MLINEYTRDNLSILCEDQSLTKYFQIFDRSLNFKREKLKVTTLYWMRLAYLFLSKNMFVKIQREFQIFKSVSSLWNILSNFTMYNYVLQFD